MQGYGKHLTNVDESQRKQAENDALLMREMALADFRGQIAERGAEKQGYINAAQERVRTDENIRETRATLGPKADAEIRVAQGREAAQLEREYRLLPLKTRMELTLEEFKQNRLDQREEYSQARQTERTLIGERGQTERSAADRQARLDANPIGTTRNAAGEEVYVFAPGARARTVTARGSIADKPTSEGGSIIQRAGAQSTARAGADRPAPTVRRGMAAPDLNEFYPIVDAISPGLSPEERKARALEMARTYGQGK